MVLVCHPQIYIDELHIEIEFVYPPVCKILPITIQSALLYVC